MRREPLHAKSSRLLPDSRPRRLTVAITASAVLVTGAGATTVALAWPAIAAPGNSGGHAQGGAGHRPPGPGQLLTSEHGQTVALAGALPAAAQGRLTELAAQRQIAVRQARAAARRAEARRAARLAAQRRAAVSSPAPSGPAPSSPAPPPAPSGSPQHIALGLLGSYGWASSQFSCLDPLWAHESGWSVTAANPSGAYGIPQALPGSKMASAGPDWQTDAATQIRWGLGYIRSVYGSPCAAWAHEQSAGWY